MKTVANLLADIFGQGAQRRFGLILDFHFEFHCLERKPRNRQTVYSQLQEASLKLQAGT